MAHSSRNRRHVRLANATGDSITGTSTSTPTPMASAAPELADRLGDSAEKVTLVVLLKQLGQAHVGFVIAGPFGDGLKSANSTLTVQLDGHPAYTARATGKSTTSPDADWWLRPA